MKRYMSKRKMISVMLLVVIGTLGYLAISFFSPKEVSPEFVFSYAENQTQDYPTTLGAKRFAELVEEKTGGRIRILVQADGELGTENDVIKQMQCGGIDFARVSLSQLAEYVSQLNVLQMPYLYTGSEHMWKVLDGEIGEEFLTVPEDGKLVGLSWYDAGARNFYNSIKPITCIEDVAGMKIRVQESQLMSDMVEALGATAVQIGYADVYSSLERGIVDGAENNWPSYQTMQHYEVAEYFTIDEHTRVPEMQICSKYTWEKLSDEDQKILTDCARESALYERKLWMEQEEKSKNEAIAHGTVVVELSAAEKKRFQDAMALIYEKYCGDYMDIIEKIIEIGK